MDVMDEAEEMAAGEIETAEQEQQEVSSGGGKSAD